MMADTVSVLLNFGSYPDSVAHSMILDDNFMYQFKSLMDSYKEEFKMTNGKDWEYSGHDNEHNYIHYV